MLLSALQQCVHDVFYKALYACAASSRLPRNKPFRSAQARTALRVFSSLLYMHLTRSESSRTRGCSSQTGSDFDRCILPSRPASKSSPSNTKRHSDHHMPLRLHLQTAVLQSALQQGLSPLTTPLPLEHITLGRLACTFSSSIQLQVVVLREVEGGCQGQGPEVRGVACANDRRRNARL